MLGNVFKALLGMTGCASAGLGAWLWLDDTIVAMLDYPRPVFSCVLIGSGVMLTMSSIWARARSLLGLVAMASGTGLISWAILYVDLNVWQLIPLWIAAFFGTFVTIVYLIAACRGKDAF